MKEKCNKTQGQTDFKRFLYVKRKKLGFLLKNIQEMSDESKILVKAKGNINLQSDNSIYLEKKGQ